MCGTKRHELFGVTEVDNGSPGIEHPHDFLNSGMPGSWYFIKFKLFENEFGVERFA